MVESAEQDEGEVVEGRCLAKGFHDAGSHELLVALLAERLRDLLSNILPNGLIDKQ